MKKKVKSKNSGNKTLTKTEKCDSFFHYFYPPIVDDDMELDEEEATELQKTMEEDYDIGEIIKKNIIPEAVNWFTGTALMDEDEDEDYDEDDDEDEYDDDDDDEDDDEDDEDEDDEIVARGPSKKASAVTKKVRSKKAGGGSGGGDPEQPECKQQ